MGLIASAQRATAGATPGRNTSGATLLVWATSSDSAFNGNGITDTVYGNTPIPLNRAEGTGATAVRLFYAVVTTPLTQTGAGHTATVAAGAQNSIIFAAFDLVLTSSPFDQQSSSGTSNPASAARAGSFTPATSDQLILAAWAGYPSPAGLAVDGGFTIVEQVPNVGGVNYELGLAYLIQSAAAAVNCGWTFSGGGGSAAVQASFKANAGGGGGGGSTYPGWMQAGGWQ